MSQQVTSNSQSNKPPLVSILINNYNYANFLNASIDSALSQTYPYIEVIVVDDGSTDRSREIILEYQNLIIPILKTNAGQASAFNVGVEGSKGDILFFLDSDDIFHPDKVEKIVDLLAQVIAKNPNVLIFNKLTAIAEDSSPLDADSLGGSCEWQDLHRKDKQIKLLDEPLTKISTPDEVYKHAIKYRYIPYLASPTSGFAMTRALANKVFPLPDQDIKTSADDFLVKAASLLGEIYSTSAVLTEYRIHGSNNWYGQKKPVQKIFLYEIDKFLNSKLESSGRKPVLSYFNSVHAQVYYREQYSTYQHYSKQLFMLATKAILWHIDLRTIKFFFKTAILATYYSLFTRSLSR